MFYSKVTPSLVSLYLSFVVSSVNNGFCSSIVSYRCVTGCPKKQNDHAIRMARFAAEIMIKMNQLKHNLAPQLGDDTRNLEVRIGMHSGPVTAGVLRGAKARFQLFGDVSIYICCHCLMPIPSI